MCRSLFLVVVISLSIVHNGWADSALLASIRDLANLARYGSSSVNNTLPSSPGEYRSAISPTSSSYWPVIIRASKAQDIDPFLIQAVILHESNFDPWAVSSKGAQGLMQLMPQTAREMGVRNSFDPEQNINGGSRYLRLMINRFGNNYEALLAYNAGPNRIERAKERRGKIPSESYRYATRVLDSYKIMRERR